MVLRHGAFGGNAGAVELRGMTWEFKSKDVASARKLKIGRGLTSPACDVDVAWVLAVRDTIPAILSLTIYWKRWFCYTVHACLCAPVSSVVRQTLRGSSLKVTDAKDPEQLLPIIRLFCFCVCVKCSNSGRD